MTNEWDVSADLESRTHGVCEHGGQGPPDAPRGARSILPQNQDCFPQQTPLSVLAQVRGVSSPSLDRSTVTFKGDMNRKTTVPFDTHQNS